MYSCVTFTRDDSIFFLEATIFVEYFENCEEERRKEERNKSLGR